jgi:hypothetical protein
MTYEKQKNKVDKSGASKVFISLLLPSIGIHLVSLSGSTKNKENFSPDPQCNPETPPETMNFITSELDA